MATGTVAGAVEATEGVRGAAGCGVAEAEGLATASVEAGFDDEKIDIGLVKKATNGFELVGFSAGAAGAAGVGVAVAVAVPE